MARRSDKRHEMSKRRSSRRGINVLRRWKKKKRARMTRVRMRGRVIELGRRWTRGSIARRKKREEAIKEGRRKGMTREGRKGTERENVEQKMVKK